MNYQNILITGGAGFVGSNLCLKLKEKYPSSKVIALDNLMRRGSELNLPRLKKNNVTFVHGDIRNKEDLELDKDIDLIIECSAEPSVLAGINSTPNYLLNTNLLGTINCLEIARKYKSDFVFLSTSRVYPIKEINNLTYKEKETRFELSEEQNVPGVSSKGISEHFPLGQQRSLYGATKLCAEHLLQEYIGTYNIKGVVNRCGVIAGPWQMGKVDQGFITLWMAQHIFKGSLSYIGYGGKGKQVRDFIHIDDLFNLIDIQLNNINLYNRQTFNVGGGRENSVSLLELTKLCEKITGNKIKISSVEKNRATDIRIYLTDSSEIENLSKWKVRKNLNDTLKDIYSWIKKNKELLKPILT